MTRIWVPALAPLINDRAEERNLKRYKNPFAKYIPLEQAAERINLSKEYIAGRVIRLKSLFGYIVDNQLFIHPECLPKILGSKVLSDVKKELRKPIYI